MTEHEFFLALAFAHKLHRSTHVALAVNTKYSVVAIGETSTTHDYDTAVVNILQNHSVSAMQDTWLYCTYEPTEMCIGMACMRGVEKIIYLDGSSVIKERTVKEGPGVPVDGERVTFKIATHACTDACAPVCRHWHTNRCARPCRHQCRTLPCTPPCNLGTADDVDTPGEWSDATWTRDWLTRLAKESNRSKSTDRSRTALKSYQEADAFSSRPASHLSTLQGYLREGLANMPEIPMLYPGIRDRLFMAIALTLVGRALSPDSKRTTRLPGGHNVGAILVSPQNRIIAWGLNMMNLHGTFHAETAMILAYLRRENVSRLPDGCRLYTSLKPCHMCAGFIATVANDIRVFVAQDDPNIKDSALDLKGSTNKVQKFSKFNISVAPFATSPSFQKSDTPKSMTVAQILSGLMTDSGMKAAIAFLYSTKARDFFEHVRSRPNELNKALKKHIDDLSPPASLTLRPKSLPGSRLNINAYDLATERLSQPTRPLPLDVFRHPLFRPTVVNRDGDIGLSNPKLAKIELANASPRLKGLDLAVDHINVKKHLCLPVEDARLKGTIEILDAAHLLFERLRTLGFLR